MDFSCVRILSLKGKEALPFLSDLALLRISVFCSYPYLYVGDQVYEEAYLSTYASCPDFLLVVMKAGEKIVGASTALPLRYETDCCKKAFDPSEYCVEDICYFGESLIVPAYRNRGFYKHFFQHREAFAKAQGYRNATFCAVNRDVHDVRRPYDYFPLNGIWQKYGYSERKDIKAYFSWKEMGEVDESEKEMIFWVKDLACNASMTL